MDANTESASVVTTEWRGPLPPPSTLAAFDAVVQGSAERILRMTEQEQLYRHETTRALIEKETKLFSRGQWLGFVVSIGSIAGAIGTAVIGVHWLISVALVGVPLMSVVRAFLKK